jgi:prepilin peptidase dependent protein B
MKKQQGLTLLELMIALALGLFIIAATLSVFISTLKSSSDTIKATRLNHDLEMAVNLMGNDIKRAGYSGTARINSNARNNPFTQATTDVRIFNLASPTTALTNAPGDCVLYSYDENGDGSVQDTERYGFRLSNGTLEVRLSGTTTADCSNGVWQRFIDNTTLNVVDARFSFVALAPLTATSRCINLATNVVTDGSLTCAAAGTTANPLPHTIAVRRVVNIVLTGEVIGDNIVRKTVTSSVQIRNNRFYAVTTAP